jgi:sulfur carrier protein ThiS
MPTVFIPHALRPLVNGQETVEAAGSTVREVVNNLDPALRAALLDGAGLKANLAVAVDGAVAPMGLLERVEPTSEIHFVAAISGGAEGQ